MLASEAHIAAGFGARLIGLVGRRRIAADYALGIPGCGRVHSFGVLLTLDIAYCDRDGQVLRLVENLKPNRIAPGARGAWIAWETRGGGFAGRISEGQRLILQAPSK
jgi:uncharacterized membrane protein (UPF0127 family)